MSDLFLHLTSHGVKLVPFLLSVAVYFALGQDPHGDLKTTLLKCAPIVCLEIYIFLKGVEFNSNYIYSQRILLGLTFSCVGDALLNLDLFPHGMAAFAIAQVCYISAFDWKPLKLAIGICLYVVGAIAIILLSNRVDDGVLMVGLSMYMVLLMTMCWRALARASQKKDFLSVFCAVGSEFFVISDTMIIINMFIVEIPYQRILIMSTYYLAQFAITLSTADDGKLQKLKTTPHELIT